MRRLNKCLRYLLYALMAFLGLLGALAIYLASVALVDDPVPANTAVLKSERSRLDSNCYVLGNNWIRKNDAGLWEMYVEGDPFERGVINGKLSKELVIQQEEAFSAQISKLIPSKFYRGFLKYFIGWFNRDLEKNVKEEYRQEIFGVSRSASHEFDYIGSPYQRILNYHGAHDIGHALQSMMLVGCSSFGTWNSRSEDSTLILGRNFDFYVGDAFAENKIVLFYKPKQGHRFMMVTWGGFTGVVSGMNMAGITVTINAAKSDMPSGSATPISLVAREILQYAGTIEEAVKIARSRKTFVSESFLIGSAADNKAVIIEKTPDSLGVYTGGKDEIICTNHYQSTELVKSLPNKEQMEASASVYRYERIQELLGRIEKNTPQKAAELLRDQLGKGDSFIGYGNEKAVNQLICHHSIIFEPAKKLVWVSSNPWQLGAYICYDLNTVFAMKGLKQNHAVNDSSRTILADPFLKTGAFKDFREFRRLKQIAQDGGEIDPKQLTTLNSGYYDAYVIAGDYLFKRKKYQEALPYYQKALSKEIATLTEKEKIRRRIEECKKK